MVRKAFMFKNGKRTGSFEDNDFENCPIHALRCEVDGITFSFGVVIPGKYDWGESKVREKVTITSGFITINGTKYSEGEFVVLEKGGENIWDVEKLASYKCEFVAY